MGVQRVSWDDWSHPDSHDPEIDNPREPGAKLCREMVDDPKSRRHYVGIMKKMAIDERDKEAKDAKKWEERRRLEAQAAQHKKDSEFIKRRAILPSRTTSAKSQIMWALLGVLALVGHPAGLRATPLWMLAGGVFTAAFSIYLTINKSKSELLSALSHPATMFHCAPRVYCATLLANIVVLVVSLSELFLLSASVVHCLLLACTVNQCAVSLQDIVCIKYHKTLDEEAAKEKKVEEEGGGAGNCGGKCK